MCGINGISMTYNSGTCLMHTMIDMYEMYKAHRGSHSHGIAWIVDGKLKTFRKMGPPDLNYITDKYAMQSTISAIGHVRLASQGSITLENAHPFFNNDVALIHNGHAYFSTTKARLAKTLGVQTRGDTDSEMLFHLFVHYWNKSTDAESIKEALKRTLTAAHGMVNIMLLFKDGTIAAYKDNTLQVLEEEDYVSFASVPPTKDTKWKHMQMDELIIAKAGKIVFRAVIKINSNNYGTLAPVQTKKEQTHNAKGYVVTELKIQVSERIKRCNQRILYEMNKKYEYTHEYLCDMIKWLGYQQSEADVSIKYLCNNGLIVLRNGMYKKLDGPQKNIGCFSFKLIPVKEKGE